MSHEWGETAATSQFIKKLQLGVRGVGDVGKDSDAMVLMSSGSALRASRRFASIHLSLRPLCALVTPVAGGARLGADRCKQRCGSC